MLMGKTCRLESLYALQEEKAPCAGENVQLLPVPYSIWSMYVMFSEGIYEVGWRMGGYTVSLNDIMIIGYNDNMITNI